MRREVRTQAELDAALAFTDVPAGDRLYIDIVSEAGVWLEVTKRPAFDSASVRAYDSASVRALGSASVTAYDSASVMASDSASVTAYDSASVRAYDSASVRALGSASVTAYDSASVTAFGSASVTAYDSASVTASDSASVTAFGSASVTAFGSASVTAFGSASVRASSHVAVHLHSARVTVEGGVVIDVTALDLNDATAWAGYAGATVNPDGEVVLYKAVDADLKSERGFAYPIGETVECPDWAATNDCGGGLHLSPHPHQALAYFSRATRFLRCVVALDDLRPIPGYPNDPAKAKARRVTVLAEVDIHGKDVR
jgi:hypothetical protein